MDARDEAEKNEFHRQLEEARRLREFAYSITEGLSQMKKILRCAQDDRRRAQVRFQVRCGSDHRTPAIGDDKRRTQNNSA